MEGIQKSTKLEIGIIILCTLAASIGPALFVGEGFGLLFILGGLVATLISGIIIWVAGVSHRTLDRAIKNSIFRFIISSTIVGLGYIYLIVFRDMNIIEVLILNNRKVLLKAIILLITAIVISISLFYKDKKFLDSLCKLNMCYFFPILLSIIIVLPGMPNSEGATIVWYTLLIYLFLRMIKGIILSE